MRVSCTHFTHFQCLKEYLHTKIKEADCIDIHCPAPKVVWFFPFILMIISQCLLLAFDLLEGKKNTSLRHLCRYSTHIYQCKTPVTYSEIQMLVDKAYFSKYEEFSLQGALKADSNVR